MIIQVYASLVIFYKNYILGVTYEGYRRTSYFTDDPGFAIQFSCPHPILGIVFFTIVSNGTQFKIFNKIEIKTIFDSNNEILKYH